MSGRLTRPASSLSADQIAAAASGITAPGGSLAGDGPGIAAAMTTRATGENFPVALRLLPARHRAHLMAVYGFARTVDDIGDKAPVAERARLLDELEADLGRLYAGIAGPASAAPDLGVIRALRPVVSHCAIPRQPFLDLIQANRQDQIVRRYPRFDDLLGYCRLSANPVGRIVLHVFGASLVGTLRGFARAAVAGYVAGGRAALAAIAAADHDVLSATPRPTSRRTAAELLRCYATGR